MPRPPASDTGAHVHVVRRSDRARRARITISAAGDVVVVLPRRAPLAEAARLVREHEAWVARHVERLQAQRARLAARPGLLEGRVLEVYGQPLTAVLESDHPPARPPAHGHVRPVGDHLAVRLGADGLSAAGLLEGWLRGRAREVITRTVAARAAEMGVRPSRIVIRDQASRWASASPRGTLSFNWRLVLAPPEVLDAVVVHELAHLRIQGHARTFWDLVERFAPQTRKARAWLRTHAAEMRAALE